MLGIVVDIVTGASAVILACLVALQIAPLGRVLVRRKISTTEAFVAIADASKLKSA